MRPREGAQDRVEQILRAALALLRADGRRLFIAHRGHLLAPKLVAAETGEIDIVLRIIARVGRILDGRDKAPTPAELHGANADQVHPRLIDRAVGLLHQQALDAAPAEVAGERQSNRTATDDQNRDVASGHRHTETRTNRSSTAIGFAISDCSAR